VLPPTCFRPRNNHSGDREVPVGIAGIDDRDGHRRPLAHVGRLDPVDANVDEHGVAIVVDPQRRHVWCAVGADRGQVPERLTFE